MGRGEGLWSGEWRRCAVAREIRWRCKRVCLRGKGGAMEKSSECHVFCATREKIIE